MNQITFVQIAERLEGLAGKLPEKIRRPVLRELTPLKELFLQQRRPRFLFIGSSKTPMPEIIDMLFSPDARDAGNSAQTQIRDDLRREPADVVFFFDDGESNLNDPIDIPLGETKIIG